MSFATAQQTEAAPTALTAWLSQLAEHKADMSIGWLDQARQKAKVELAKSGRLPGRKDERWKYFSLQILESSLPGLIAGHPEAISEGSALLDDTGAALLRIRTGSKLSIPAGLQDSLPAGVKLLTLQQAAAEPHLVEQLQVLVSSIDQKGPSRVFEALNTADLHDALIIQVAAGVDAGRLHIQWQQAAETRLDNFRIFILLEKNAVLQLLESYAPTPAAGESVSAVFNLLTQAELAKGARMDHLRVQGAAAGQHLLQFVRVNQAAESVYRYTGFELGGGLVRNDLVCNLNGANASSDLAAAFVGNGESCIDHHLVVDHQAPHCRSEQTFRGVLGGRSKGVFNGKALIRSGADGSSVRQSNANLLLSDLAEMNTKPELEIYADEVEASHGATVGQLDEQALFYMQARGIGEDDARRILTGAFCRAIGARLSDRKLVEQVEKLLDAAMPGLEEQSEITG